MAAPRCARSARPWCAAASTSAKCASWAQVFGPAEAQREPTLGGRLVCCARSERRAPISRAATKPHSAKRRRGFRAWAMTQSRSPLFLSRDRGSQGFSRRRDGKRRRLCRFGTGSFRFQEQTAQSSAGSRSSKCGRRKSPCSTPRRAASAPAAPKPKAPARSCSRARGRAA